MKILCVISIIWLSLSSVAIAQSIKIEQIIKENEVGEITGCGFEFVATNGIAEGVLGQAILYSLGNLNWDMGLHLIAGKVNRRKQFTQEQIINASLINQRIGEMSIINNGVHVFRESIEEENPVPLIQSMLEDGFSVSFSTDQIIDGYVEVNPTTDILDEYREDCYKEMVGMLREHYRDFHGNTLCLDDPTSC